MQQTLQTIFGMIAILLAGMAVVGALAMLVVAEGYYLVRFWTRLYWRYEALRQARHDARRPLRTDPGGE
jgi:hypothetical protein